MEEHRETVADPSVVEAGDSTQCVVQKYQPVTSNIK